MAKKKAVQKRMTKAQLVSELAQMADIDKKTVNEMFSHLSQIIARELGKDGPGEFVIPGLVKLKVVDKPATKEREGVNPFTGEKMIIKAKPASKKVRVTAMKALKDMV